MTLTSPAAPAAKRPVRGGALYRLVWKWHFLAALYVLPFMLILSLSGGLYLYKPQIEEWLYADRLNVAAGGDPLPFSAQIGAVEDQAGLTRLRSVTDPGDPARSTLIEFEDRDKIRSYAWVDPYSAQVIAVQPRDETFMRIVRKFHGELLMGGFGTKFVELAAHWSIVMIVTGVYLWWPRGPRRLSDAVRPPRGTGRGWWRETHLFTGMLAAVLITPLLLSGLPWTDIWGGSLSAIQDQTGQKSLSLRFGGKVPNSTADTGTPLPFEAVLATAHAEGLAAPYEMRPPKGVQGAYWLRSAAPDRGEQTELVIDQYSGAVLKRIDFADNPPVARAVSYGISLHQGELYGWLNLAQNTLAAGLGLLLSVSGFVAWWMRRPAGKLGVPAAPDAALGRDFGLLIIGIGIVLPLVGASLLLALGLDWLLFRRLGWFRDGTIPQPAE
ncbi:PepSY-associated TM helix domain-containing protein [Actibacterium sp. D379-3]